MANYLQQYLQRGGYDPSRFDVAPQQMPIMGQADMQTAYDEGVARQPQGQTPALWSDPASFAAGDEGQIGGAAPAPNSMNKDWGAMFSQIMKMFGG